MGIFKKQNKSKTYDKATKIPIIRASICTGEQVAGFKDINTGAFEDIMLIRDDNDLQTFKKMYDIEGIIGKEY